MAQPHQDMAQPHGRSSPSSGITRCSAGQTWEEGKNKNLKNSLNVCFCIPLPSLPTQRKMLNGSERGWEWERGSRCPGADWLHQSRAPSIPGFVLQVEMDPWASWAGWGDPKTTSTSIPLGELTLDPSLPWASLIKGTGKGNSSLYLHYYSRE